MLEARFLIGGFVGTYRLEGALGVLAEGGEGTARGNRRNLWFAGLLSPAMP